MLESHQVCQHCVCSDFQHYLIVILPVFTTLNVSCVLAAYVDAQVCISPDPFVLDQSVHAVVSF